MFRSAQSYSFSPQAKRSARGRVESERSTKPRKSRKATAAAAPLLFSTDTTASANGWPFVRSAPSPGSVVSKYFAFSSEVARPSRSTMRQSGTSPAWTPACRLARAMARYAGTAPTRATTVRHSPSRP